jgi:hypothetical protein
MMSFLKKIERTKKYRLIIEFKGIQIWVLFFIIFLNVKPALALDWDDSEWINAGCPSGIIGTWIASDLNNVDKKIVSINSHIITITNNQDLEQQFSWNNKPRFEKGRFVEINMRALSKGKNMSVYLKIRPHLIKLVKSSDDASLSTYECLIKIFYYDSQQNSNRHQYTDWEFYGLQK